MINHCLVQTKAALLHYQGIPGILHGKVLLDAILNNVAEKERERDRDRDPCHIDV